MVSKTVPVLEHARPKSARVPNTRSAAPTNCTADAETVIRPSSRFNSSTSRRKEASLARVTMQAPTVWTGAPEFGLHFREQALQLGDVDAQAGGLERLQVHCHHAHDVSRLCGCQLTIRQRLKDRSGEGREVRRILDLRRLKPQEPATRHRRKAIEEDLDRGHVTAPRTLDRHLADVFRLVLHHLVEQHAGSVARTKARALRIAAPSWAKGHNARVSKRGARVKQRLASSVNLPPPHPRLPAVCLSWPGDEGSRADDPDREGSASP